MRIITVEINDEYCKVNNYPKHRYKIPEMLLKRFEKEELSTKELQFLGYQIFLSLFPTKEMQELLTPSKGEEILIVIKSDSPEVHNIPFELICTDHSQMPETSFLLKNEKVSLIRASSTVKETRPPLKRPLKILFILSQPLRIMERAPIDPLREVKRVKEALREYVEKGWVELKIEVKASLQHLRNRLKEGYDIVHFSGHGESGGFIYLERDGSPEEPLKAGVKEIASLFKESPLPYLIYIDACETSKSLPLLPSLTYELHKELRGVTVIGNMLRISDRGATESVEKFYSQLFNGYPHKLISAIRTIPGFSEWYKTVCFTTPQCRLFEKPQEERKKEEVKEFPRIAKSKKHFVYRYDLVRKTADAVKEDNHLLLHGIAGMGKSTLARYLCEFFESEFESIVFIDLEEEEIETPKELVDYLCYLFKVESEEDQLKSLQKLKEKLKGGRLLLVLDNAEYSLQEKEEGKRLGKVKKEWKRLLESLLKDEKMFVIFTSRLKLFLSKRESLTNTITISEFKEPDLLLLKQWLSKDKKNFLTKEEEKLKEELGLYPYAISFLLEHEIPAERLKEVLRERLKEEETAKFYQDYFEKHPELNLLVSLPFPVSKRFLAENYPQLIDLISRLALAEEVVENSVGYYKFFKALRLFTKEVSKEISKEFLSKVEKDKGKEKYDYLNWLYAAPQKLKPVKEILSLYRESAYHLIGKEVVEKLLKEIKELKEENIKTPDYATTLNNLASLLSCKGELNEAEELCRKSFEAYDEAVKKGVAPLNERLLRLLGIWLQLRLLFGIGSGGREFFEKLCLLLTYEDLFETKGFKFSKFLPNLVYLLLSLPEPKKREILSELKSSFEECGSSLTPLCKKKVAEVLELFERRLSSKEDKI